MFIECFKNNGTDYLRIIDGYSYTENGVKKHKRRVIRNIGPLSRYTDGQPDYLSRLRQSFKEGNPLIESLADLVESKNVRPAITLTFDPQEDKDSYCCPKNIGYFVLDSLYDQLGIYDVLNLHKSRKAIDYDLNGNAKLLVFGRVLSPDSKLATFENKADYLFPVTKCERLPEIYTTLDCLNDKAAAIQKRMNVKIGQTVGRNTRVCFYDVTNYYFEIGENDQDVLNEEGEVVQCGLRKKGVSKENRKEPIVQMGLFMDDNGLPIAYQLFPGNRTDQTTLQPAMEKTIETMSLGKVIVVADGGLNSGPNIAHLLAQGNGYIVSKSTKKSDKAVKSWLLDEADYRWNETGSFKVKSMVRTRKVKDKDGHSLEITEKLIGYWSKKHYERERHENEPFIAYLNSVLAFPDKLKDKSKKIEKFLKKEQIDKTTGEVVQTTTAFSLDMEKIQEYLDLMGYYTIMTSEIEQTDEEIINQYHGLSRIEDSFRITKSDLLGRPVFVNTPEHINAHFLTCFMALTMIRLIQLRILRFLGKESHSPKGWESGLSAERIQKALWDWRADPLPGGYYRLTKPSEDLALIARAFGIDPYLTLPIEPDLRKLKRSFDLALM